VKKLLNQRFSRFSINFAAKKRLFLGFSRKNKKIQVKKFQKLRIADQKNLCKKNSRIFFAQTKNLLKNKN
jgi:hypothetical protein